MSARSCGLSVNRMLLFGHHLGRAVKRKNCTNRAGYDEFFVNLNPRLSDGFIVEFRLGELGSPSGGVNFFNAMCRLLVYEGSFLTRLSDLPISIDSFVCAGSVSAGDRLRSAFSIPIDPPQS